MQTYNSESRQFTSDKNPKKLGKTISTAPQVVSNLNIVNSGVDLIKWMVDNDAKISKRLSLGHSHLGGTGVFAARKIKKDETLLEIPKSLVLSPRTCGIANIFDEDMHPVLMLATAYNFEKAQGGKSPWAPFIKFIEEAPLPDIPRLWTKSEQKYLDHSDIALQGGLDIGEMEEGYREIEGLLTDHGLEVPTFDAIRDTLARISSRAFFVDQYHNMSLVPGACLFNHSDREDVHFESNADVCDLCGSDRCNCTDADLPDVGDESDHTASHMETSDASGTEDGDDGDDDNDDDCCEIRAIRDIPKGKEIYNTYGDSTNAVLLSIYGFAIDGNRHETVSLVPQLLKFVRDNDLGIRVKSWKTSTKIDSDEWKDLITVRASGKPSSKFMQLLRVLTMNAREYFLYTHTSLLPRKRSRGGKAILAILVDQRLLDERSALKAIEHAAGMSQERVQNIQAVLNTEVQVLRRARQWAEL